MLAFLLILIIPNWLLITAQSDSSNIKGDLAIDAIVQTEYLISDDSLSTLESDSAIYVAIHEPSLSYRIEKHIQRAINAAKHTLASLHVKDRFPLHIILFTICFSIVIITAIDASKRKKP